VRVASVDPFSRSVFGASETLAPFSDALIAPSRNGPVVSRWSATRRSGGAGCVFGVADPLKVMKKLLHIGPRLLPARLERHLDGGLPIARAVLNLQQISHRFHQ
jgi:hypothetical protein